jgi:hypothetical protein
MSVHNAVKLIQSLDSDFTLRNQMYACKHISELDSFLNKNNIWFQMDEFEEAFNMLHVKCQTIEEANDLFQKKDWYCFLFASMRRD